MQNKSDAQLLGDYAAQHAEPAFAEIVARHTDLVYSAALRQTGSPELAREIAQNVFTDLARKARPLAGTLSDDASLAGWLFRGTRFAGLKLLRDDQRRQTRERQFMEDFNPAPDTAPDWERVAPVLDEAMAELGDADHEAVLLRYFKNHDFHAVGLALGVSDEAAQKRVSRAVERLREFFAKRGLTVGTSGLVVVISANAVQAAPTGLAGTILTAAVPAGTTIAGTATVAALKTIAMTVTQKVLIAAVFAAAGGAGIYEAHRAWAARTQVQTVQTPATAGHAPGSYVSKDQLSFVGYSTPEAGLESYFWASMKSTHEAVVAARSEGDTLNDRIAPEVREATQAARKRTAARFQGIRIVARKTIAPDNVELKVKVDIGKLPGDVGEMPPFLIHRMIKTGEEWKIRGGARPPAETWDQEGQIEKFHQ